MRKENKNENKFDTYKKRIEYLELIIQLDFESLLYHMFNDDNEYWIEYYAKESKRLITYYKNMKIMRGEMFYRTELITKMFYN